MADSKLIVTSSDSNNQLVQKTIPNINPDADNYALKSFGQKVTALTDNTLSKVERVDKTNITSATEKLTPLIRIADNEETPLTRTVALDGYIGALEVVGDGEISIIPDDTTTWLVTLRYGKTSQQWRILVGCFTSADAQAAATAPYDIVLRTAETDNYKAGEFRITIANE